jgi:glycosyltransferase involved in cell wall biosynthesis
VGLDVGQARTSSITDVAYARPLGPAPYPGVPPEIGIVVTARNEADLLPQTLSALAAAFPGASIVVADDGSTDATSEVAGEGGADIVRSARPVGKGGAATPAAERLLEAGVGRAVVLCDGDLGGSAAQLVRLVEAVDAGAGDLAVASFARRVGGGFGIAVGFARWAVARRTGLELSAPISGQRAMRPDVLRAVLPFAAGFGMEIGMTVDAHRAGFRLVEIELDLEHRATGRSAAGFVHRARQLAAFARVYASRR